MKLLILVCFHYGIKVDLKNAGGIMETLICLFSLIIWGFIIFAHTWGFWRVYNSSFGEQPGFVAMGKGLVAGFVGWFWLCFAIGLWNLRNGGSWILIIWFYGLLIVPLIGMILTVLFWWVISTFELEIGFWSRVILGLTIGLLIGFFLGTFLDSKNHNDNRSAATMLIFLLTSIGVTSGIMAGERKIYD